MTSLFNTNVLFNSTHVVFKLIFSTTISAIEMGWLSIGHGTTMSNSRMMIMWPVVGEEQTGVGVGVGGRIEWKSAYCRATGHALPTVIWSPSLGSIRTEGTIENQTHPLTLEYTRPWSLSSFDTLKMEPDQKLVWAISSIKPTLDQKDTALLLNFHDKGHGVADFDLSYPQNPASSYNLLNQGRITKITELKHSKRHDVLITLHATFLTIAWGLLAPSAILTVRFLQKQQQQQPQPETSSTKKDFLHEKKKKMIIKIHMVIQLTTILLTIFGILCAFLAVQLGNDSNNSNGSNGNGGGSHFDTFQKRLGFFVLFLALFQFFLGYFIHKRNNNNNSDSNSKDQIVQVPIQKKLMVNQIHRIVGYIILPISWITIELGIKEWKFLGRDTPLSVSILFFIFISFFFLLFLTSFFFRKKN